MNEGYYEEPLKWTLRPTDGVYENERRDGNSDWDKLHQKAKIPRTWGFYEWPKITNTTILLTVVGSSVISLISLIVLIQSSNTSDKDLTRINHMLLELRNNITADKSPPATNATIPPNQNESSNCETSYRDKCFRLVTVTSNLSLAEARSECRKMKAVLANIYSLNHFKQISVLLKNSIRPGAQGITAWTGMAVNGKTRRMVLTDFRLASVEVPWYPGRYFAAKMPYLGIKIRSTTNLYARGMYDARSSERFYTAVCETDTKPCKN